MRVPGIGWLLFTTALAVVAPAARADLVPVPALVQRVTDLTTTLDAAQRQQLEQRLADFEAAKGSQIAILIVPTTGPEDIEPFSLGVAEHWQLGRKGVDDGVLMLVAERVVVDRRERERHGGRRPLEPPILEQLGAENSGRGGQGDHHREPHDRAAVAARLCRSANRTHP